MESSPVPADRSAPPAAVPPPAILATLAARGVPFAAERAGGTPLAAAREAAAALLDLDPERDAAAIGSAVAAACEPWAALPPEDRDLLAVALRLRLRGESSPYAWFRHLAALPGEHARLGDRGRAQFLLALAAAAGLDRPFDGNEEGSRLVDLLHARHPDLDLFGELLEDEVHFRGRLVATLHLIANLRSSLAVKRDLVEALLDRHLPADAPAAERSALRAALPAFHDLMTDEAGRIATERLGVEAPPEAPVEPPAAELPGGARVDGTTDAPAAAVAELDRLHARAQFTLLRDRVLRLMLHILFAFVWLGSVSAGRMIDALVLAAFLLPALALFLFLFRRRPFTAPLCYEVLLLAASKFSGGGPGGVPLLASELPLLVLAMAIVADHHLLAEPPPLAVPRLAAARAALAALPAAIGPGAAFSLAVSPAAAEVWLLARLRRGAARLTLCAEEREERAGSASGGEGAVRVGRFRLDSDPPLEPPPPSPAAALLEPDASGGPGRAVYTTMRDYYARPDALARELARAASALLPAPVRPAAKDDEDGK